MYTLIVLVIGIFIGWNLPQPAWAKSLQDRVVATIRSLLQKNGSGSGGTGSGGTGTGTGRP